MKQPLTSQAHTHRPQPWPRSTRGQGQIIETKAKTEAKAEASRIWPRDQGQASRPNIPASKYSFVQIQTETFNAIITKSTITEITSQWLRWCEEVFQAIQVPQLHDISIQETINLGWH